jgi:protein-S-isoprenylcysteine O-methyltransferase Ste14
LTDENPFRVALLIVSVVQTAISVHYLRRANVAANLLRQRQAGILLTGSIVLSYITYGVGVLCYLIEPRWMMWAAVAVPVWARWIAVGPLLFGGMLVIWGLHNIGTNLTISPSTKENHRLVTSGAFGWVRHPMYSGVCIESAGVCLLMANWFVSLTAAMFCALIVVRTRIEEDNLTRKFGDEYRQYQQRVGQFVPRVRFRDEWLLILRSTPVLLILLLLIYLAFAAFVFGLAGRLDLPWIWMTLGTFIASHLVMVWVVFRRDPDLARERLRPGPGIATWDKFVLKLSGVLILANLAVGPLDVGRLHLSDSVTPPLQCAGLLGIALGMALMSWAMAVNTFFSKVVRIQEERGHVVIQAGPYGVIRHPGYVGWIVLWTSYNLAIGSWLATGMSLMVSSILVVRTALEDRFLRKNLDGYEDYARRVKWRLVPGIW